MKEKTTKTIEGVPAESGGQNDAWPGEGRATKESGTDKVEDTNAHPEGTRKPERVNIPIVR